MAVTSDLVRENQFKLGGAVEISLLILVAILQPFQQYLHIGDAIINMSMGDSVVFIILLVFTFGFFGYKVPKYTIHVSILVMLAVLSLVFNSVVGNIVDIRYGLLELIKFAGSVAWMLAIFVLFKSNPRQRSWYYGLASVSTAMFVSIHGIISLLLTDLFRVNSVFENANLAAGYLMFNIFLCFYLLEWLDGQDNRELHKIFLGICSLLLLLGILATGSRSALLALMVGVVLLTIHNQQRIRNHPVISSLFVLSGFFISTIYAIFNPTLVTRIMRALSGVEGFGRRPELWSSAFTLFADQPIIGIGYNQYKVLTGMPIGTHNTFVTHLTELGILGFLVIVSLFLSVVRDGYLISRQSYEEVVYFSIFIISLLVHGFFHGVINYRTLWVCIGIIGAFKASQVGVEEI